VESEWSPIGKVGECKDLSIIFGGLLLLPTVSALPDASNFPDIPFKDFNQFIQEYFDSDITLSQVLVVLFTLTENTGLLSLHARQQNPKYPGEAVRATPLRIPKRALCGLYKNSGLDEMRLMDDCDRL